MATYTITIDERTKSGKQVLNYLKSHGVIEIPNETTRKAIQEIREGKGIRCKTIEEFIMVTTGPMEVIRMNLQ